MIDLQIISVFISDSIYVNQDISPEQAVVIVLNQENHCVMRIDEEESTIQKSSSTG